MTKKQKDGAEKKKSPLSLFLDDLNNDKIDILNGENAKDYVPYVVNRFVAGDLEGAFLANEMNLRRDLTKREQYSFYLGAIRKKRRFTRWIKADAHHAPDAIELLMEYYGYSRKKAEGCLHLHSEGDLGFIRAFLNKGGFK